MRQFLSVFALFLTITLPLSSQELSKGEKKTGYIFSPDSGIAWDAIDSF